METDMTNSKKPWYVKLAGGVICLILAYLMCDMIKEEINKTDKALNLYTNASFQCTEVKDHFYYDSLYGVMRVRKECTNYKLIGNSNNEIPIYPMFRNNIFNRALGIKVQDDHLGE